MKKNVSALKMHRILRGVSQEEIAFKTGMTQSAYSKLERGFSNPTSHQKEVLAEFFDVEPDRLFPNSDD